MPQPFAPEGYTKSTKKPTKSTTEKTQNRFSLFVPFMGFFVLFVILLDGYGLREISRLIDIATTSHRDVIREQL